MLGLPQAGTLYEILSSDALEFGGTGVRNDKLIHAHKQPFLDMQYSASITLPAMSTLFFRYRPRKEKSKKSK